MTGLYIVVKGGNELIFHFLNQDRHRRSDQASEDNFQRTQRPHPGFQPISPQGGTRVFIFQSMTLLETLVFDNFLVQSGP